MEPTSNTPPGQGDENYSVDEMMARLKRNERHKKSNDPSQDGELVTRADGSQVVKVRRRKRRSQQPKKQEPKSNPKLKFFILGSFIAVLLLVAAGTIFIIAKYNGRSFKEKTEATISALSGAESSELTQLRVTPISAKAAKADLTWDKHTFFHSASFTNLKADIKVTSFFSSNWIGEEVVASIGEVQMKTPAASVETPGEFTVSPYSFNAFRCNQLNIQFGTDPNAPAINGLQVSLRQQADERHQIVFSNGRLNIPSWPALEISSGVMTLNKEDAEIETRLEAGEGLSGELLIEGRIAKNINRPIVLDVKAKDYPIQEILGKELGRIIQGNVNSDMGSLSYDYKKASSEALSFIMPFNSTDLRISELPMLTDLKDLTGDTKYVHPTLTHCRGTIMRTSEGITLNDLNLVSSRMITIKGHLTVTSKGMLSGELDVGIPARLFTKTSPAPSIFSEPHNGDIFTKVTLSGSIHNPHDNLNQLLQTSRSTSSPTSGNGTRQPGTGALTPLQKAQEEAKQKEKDFEDLTR